MASASTSLGISISLHCTTSHRKTLFLGHPRTTLPNPIEPRHTSLRTSVLTFYRRRRNTSAPSPISSNKKKLSPKEDEEDGDIDEDAFNALFNMLEEDLKNDALGDGKDDDVTEEEMLMLENELAGALADDQLSGALPSTAGGETENNGDQEEDENEVNGDDDLDDAEQEEEMPLKLKTWQLKKLAYALKIGRRKTSIKNLAADVCLDRAVVLKLLREPPPSLVMMSATLPDQPVSTMLEPAEKTDTTTPVVASPVEPINKPKPEVEEKLPVHVMQKSWSSRKRLKKVHLETLELVYRRTKRPSNAMLSSIVYVTSLPRKKIIKWFEDKRAEDGIRDAQVPRVPYRRSPPENLFTR